MPEFIPERRLLADPERGATHIFDRLIRSGQALTGYQPVLGDDNRKC